MMNILAVAVLAVSSQVTDVTVFNDRALVVRSAEVELEQGISTIRFDHLPEAIDSRGIQVTGAGDAVVLDVRFKTENYEEIPEEAWKKLSDEKARLEKEADSVGQQIERFEASKEFLNAISKKVTSASGKEEGAASLDPGSWESMLALYSTKSEEYDEGRRLAREKLEGIRKALEKVNADIRDAGMHQRKTRRVVEVDLESDRAENAVLHLSYIVRGPQWVPAYDIRVDTETREMEVNYFALVRQRTGEDWSGVALKLSTANPGLGGQHPELDPWRISMSSPRAAKSRAYSFSAKALPDLAGSAEVSLANSFGSDSEVSSWAEAQPAPIKQRMSSVSRKGASVVFEVKGQSDIESDNVEHRVAVTSVKLPSVFRYSSVPKLSPLAYLKANAENTGEHPFLEGKANVFLDGNFVTSTQMELVAPGEEFWVFLGADESMKVEHKLIKKYQSKEGFGGKTVRHTYEYLMTVKNTHSVPEEVIVWDQLPISGSEGLDVELIEPKYSKDTDALKIDDEMRISWFRTLKPGEEWQIPFSFRVEAPRDMNISGL
ncbi:mucoidy inhibitor MuiA family protein [Pontiella agarivorans]|uniref:Mucoidy inhibitor MuiA family protein n=1 Tax=Pontiella agarivorans TaxID=3038953 RepID=A0ABU5MSJ1_9BACT|nr:mucoidy inhibitor MuiA family protein [Pontiella agarivorans]MDZ8117158.1 mucoidy inhibitor MuiA family protein [Pontiella agarivorans]